jgi:hypothetical protein
MNRGDHVTGWTWARKFLDFIRPTKFLERENARLKEQLVEALVTEEGVSADEARKRVEAETKRQVELFMHKKR